MHTKLTLTLLLTLIAVPCMVFGAGLPPPPVPSVQAVLEGSQIRVTWQAPEGATDIVAYRVYFSRQSILGSGGDYDDFEQTAGTETSYVFSAPPVGGAAVTFGVLAVNAEGMESEGFLVETTVQLPSQATTPAPSSPASAPMTVANGQSSASSLPSAVPLFVTAVAPVSSTGVLTTFSAPLSADGPMGPEAFLIVDGSGTLLPTVRVEVNGASVLVHTETQGAGRSYAIVITRPLQSTDGAILDPATMAPVRFTGFMTEGATPQPSTPPSPPTTPAIAPAPPYVREPLPMPAPIGTLAVRVAHEGAGDRQDIVVRWSTGPAGTARYIIAPSGGTSLTASPTDSIARITGVPAGTKLMVRVTAVDSTGQTLAVGEATAALPESGPGLFLLALFAGAAAGMIAVRRKKMA